MNARPFCFLFLIACVSSGSLHAEGEHEPAPMLAPVTSPVNEAELGGRADVQRREASASEIVKRFKERFSGVGVPRLAVFWNQELPDRVSDWRSRHRAALGISGETVGTDRGQSTDLRGQGSISSQSEYRLGRDHYQSETAFALQSGLIQSLSEAGVTVIDRAFAKRITDNALEDGTFSRLSPDQARLEMRALDRHADYVIELTVGKRFSEEELYNVRVLSVEDASVLASFTTPARPQTHENNAQWVATSSGYEKRKRPLSMVEVGRELGLQIMVHMAPSE